MKTKFVLFFFLLYLNGNGQNLKNTEWIKIQSSRKDGSKIVDRQGPDTGSVKYYFLEDSVCISVYHQYSYKYKYYIHNGILSIGESLNYAIDSLNDAFLYITQSSEQNLPDDKQNSYTFINADYLFDYAQTNKLITVSGDSLVICNDKFSPTYNGDILKLFQSQFPDINANKSITASFIITASSNIKKVEIDSSEHFSDKEIETVIKTIYSTRGLWVLPPSPFPLQFKISFRLNFIIMSYNVRGYGTKIHFFAGNDQYKTLAVKEQNVADKYFDDGVRFFNKEKYENAVNEFKQCIAIDETNTDAFYNLASSYQKLADISSACIVWKKLETMEQKNGEALYRINCTSDQSSK